MESPVSRASILNLEHFPTYQLPPGQLDQVNHLSGYFKKFISGQLQKHVNYLELPSLSTLADFFNCSYLEMYDVFRTLRAQGYDYQFASLDGTLRVWKKSV